MAKNTMVMSYVLRKFKNAKSTVNNRWFAYVNRQGTLSTRGLAQHMIEHGLVSNRAEVESVLSKLSECIPELDALGTTLRVGDDGIEDADAVELHAVALRNEFGDAL